jgi:hypothetical protein
VTQNIQKRVEDKIEQIEKMMKELNIDILITQEWTDWDVEEYKFRKCIEGYTNFMSFKKKKGRKASNILILAMNEEKKSKQLKKNMQKRKRGTTILIKNNIINQLNVNKLKIEKDGEITIELAIETGKLTIVGIRAKPSNKRVKKKIFFNKLENIIKHNIAKESR